MLKINKKDVKQIHLFTHIEHITKNKMNGNKLFIFGIVKKKCRFDDFVFLFTRKNYFCFSRDITLANNTQHMNGSNEREKLFHFCFDVDALFLFF